MTVTGHLLDPIERPILGTRGQWEHRRSVTDSNGLHTLRNLIGEKRFGGRLVYVYSFG